MQIFIPQIKNKNTQRISITVTQNSIPHKPPRHLPPPAILASSAASASLPRS